MKFLSILAAASLALAPAFASAGSSNAGPNDTANTDNGRLVSGPLAGRSLDESEIPPGVILLGSGLLLIGGAVFFLIGNNDSNNNTNGGNGNSVVAE